MKDVFFTLLAISLFLVAFGGVVYLFLHGLYRVLADWQLSRELRDLKAAAEDWRKQQPDKLNAPPFDPSVAFSDRPAPVESKGIMVFPLEPMSGTIPRSTPDAWNAAEQDLAAAIPPSVGTGTAAAPLFELPPELAPAAPAAEFNSVAQPDADHLPDAPNKEVAL